MRRLRQGDLSRESGYALPELLVAMLAGAVVLVAVMQLITVTIRESSRVEDRVDATQRGRIVLYQIMDELHSACVAPQTVPIRAGSSDTSMTFTNARGSAVSVTPVLRNITYSPATSTLSENVYNSTGGVAPNWTFSATPSVTRELLEKVQQTPGVPIFRYYAYSNGSISSTPLTTPLSSADALKTVQVTVAFDSYPGRQQVVDTAAGNAVSLQDTAFMRLSAPGYDPSSTNAPCA